jgi:hypothetical protein
MMKKELERTISRNESRKREYENDMSYDYSSDAVDEGSINDYEAYQNEIDAAVQEAERAIEELSEGY